MFITLEALRCMCRDCGGKSEVYDLGQVKNGAGLGPGYHDNDPVFWEVAHLVDILCNEKGFSPRQQDELFKAAFIASCDPIDGHNVSFLRNPFCRFCGSENVQVDEHDPPRFVEKDLPYISHSHWLQREPRERAEIVLKSLRGRWETIRGTGFAEMDSELKDFIDAIDCVVSFPEHEFLFEAIRAKEKGHFCVPRLTQWPDGSKIKDFSQEYSDWPIIMDLFSVKSPELPTDLRKALAETLLDLTQQGAILSWCTFEGGFTPYAVCTDGVCQFALRASEREEKSWTEMLEASRTMIFNRFASLKDILPDLLF